MSDEAEASTPKAERSAPATRSPARPVLVAVASGKGGVGKSTLTLCTALVLRDRGLRVGVIDGDLSGPNIPAMLGLTRRVPAAHIELWRRDGRRHRPVGAAGLSVMSTQLLVGEEQSVTLGGGMTDALVRLLFRGVDWSGHDVVLVDLPPGTTDVQEYVFRWLDIAGAILVVGPQEVAHLDARKLVRMVEHAGVAVIGGVQNMARMVCDSCGALNVLHEPVLADRSLWATTGVQPLADVPLDRALLSGQTDLAGAFARASRELVDEVGKIGTAIEALIRPSTG